MTLPASWRLRLDTRTSRGLRPARRNLPGRRHRPHQRSKADQDPAQWLPPAAGAHCRTLTKWLATKLRWQLSADTGEIEALKVFADGPCEDAAVVYTPAP